ncbi:putative odorant receptor 98b [Diachasma alloeum]|uniref:Odorant receptor n=1 Tax=Diachasma alloeum TaxID=454923 RepID=A0A4E0RQK8_9HYME|nr:putative odorant receptor 98b [Diachasma alloeum]THK33074.1 odorant receptor 183 [Diachasma alloeum]
MPQLYPDQNLDPGGVTEVRKLLKWAILALPDGAKAPTFDGVWERDGAVVVNCTDEITGNWLKSLFPESKISGHTIHVVSLSERPKKHRVVVHVEDPEITSQEALCFLEKQNKGLMTSNLLLAHVIFNRNETYDLSQTAYPAIYPFAIDSMSKYIACISIELLIFISVGAWWIAADMVFLQSATHLSSQYQILNDDLMTIKTANDTPTVSNYSPIQQLNSIGKRHAHLLLLSEKLKRLFSPILMCLMLVTSANICICIINLQEELIHKNIAGVNKCVVHTIITMIQPAIYCIYTNDLVESAERTATAAYESDWVAETQNFKKSVRLMTMRSQKGLKFRIYGFFNVDLNQLTQIGVTAARFFALMNNLS